MEKMYVCKSNRGTLYEQRQVRFIGYRPEHPWDICAVASSVEEMHSMLDGLSFDTDYSHAETPFSEITKEMFAEVTP